MLPALAETPRKMLPPPTTTATCTPSSCTCLISSATARATFTSMPKVWSPIKASPEIFSSTRRKAGTGFVISAVIQIYRLRCLGMVNAFDGSVTLSIATREASEDAYARVPSDRLIAGQLCDLVAEVVAALAQTFTHLVTSETANRDLLAGLSHFLGHHFANRLRGLLDERLIEQDELFIKLIQSSFDNLIDHLLRLACVFRIILRLGPGDLAFFVEDV